MPYALNQFFAWATFDGCGPADEIGPGAKECNDRAVPLGTALEAAIDLPTVRAPPGCSAAERAVMPSTAVRQD